VVFEDLHWTDSESLTFIDSLIESLPKAPILLLLNFRPEFQDRWSAKSYYTRVRIDPLQAKGSEELLQDKLGADVSLRALKQLLIERTEGNPFFLEESARTLIESGALDGQRGSYRLVAPITTIALPVTVQSVLAARIDRLGPEDKRLLQSASVIGKDFALGLLGEIADTDVDTVQRGLANLQAAEFIYETRLFPDREYTFKHALTHDVTYGGLLAERRQLLHANIVEAIERLHADRLTEHVDRLAYHARRGAVWEKAHTFGVQAGRRAAAQSANRAALEAFQGALAALDRLPETPQAIAENIDLRFELRDAHFVLNEMAHILPHLKQARALAERIGDRERMALAALYESGFHWIQGEHHLAVELGLRGLAAAEELDRWELRGLAHYRIGTALLFLGDHIAAADHLRKSVAALDHEAGQTLLRFGGLVLAFIASFAAWALAELGEFAEAETVGQMGFDLAVHANHAYSICVASFGLSHAYLRQGRIADAIHILERGYEQTKLSNIEAVFDQVVSRLAYAYAQAGRIEEARALGQTEVAHFSFLSSTHFLLAAIGIESDRVELTLRQAREAHQSANLRNERGNVAWMEHLFGDVAMSGSSPELSVAEKHYRTAAAIADELSMRPLLVECRIGLGAVARRAGRESEARSEFQSALIMAEEMAIESAVARARGYLQAT
jgi:tetratricopeptide (TPR) repeat protein